MRKRLFIIFILMFIMMHINMNCVNASSIKSSNSKVSVGSKITLTISNLTSSDKNYNLTYDEKYFEQEVSSCGNGKNILTEKASGTSSCEIKLKVKNQTITNDVSSLINIVSAGGSDKSDIYITIQANKTTTTTTKAPVATTITTKSNNAKLKSLKITSTDNVEIPITPNFSSNVNEYSVNVSGDVEKVLINATLDDSKASLVISDNIKEELTPGENNKLTFVVTAEDGTKNTYTINVLREALETDATLKSLKIKEAPDFKFSNDKFSYNVNVNSNVKSLTFTYVTNSDKATVEITGNENLKDGSVVKLKVISEDGSKKEYKFTVIKTKNKSTTEKVVTVSTNKNPLIIMGFSLVAFALIGGIIYVAKK